MEGMATRIPQIVPHWSALSEWPNGGVVSLPVADYQTSYNSVNTLGATPRIESYVEALHLLYTEKEKRAEVAEAGYKIVCEPQYTWNSIAQKFHETFLAVHEIEELRRVAAKKEE